MNQAKGEFPTAGRATGTPAWMEAMGRMANAFTDAELSEFFEAYVPVPLPTGRRPHASGQHASAQHAPVG